jgi:hypothetical protein
MMPSWLSCGGGCALPGMEWERPMAGETNVILVDSIQVLIRTIRGQKVLLDHDIARLFGVSTKALNQAVKRNHQRFPDDFLFQLSREELEDWRSQIVTSNSGGKMGLRRQPYAFTEHGALMAANLLNSPQAVEVSVFVVRAFIRLRELALAHKELAQTLSELERKVGQHDDSIRQLVTAIRHLMAPTPEPHRGKIGFGRD